MDAGFISLQWGRARPHAEIRDRGAAPGRGHRASMGPRASARGNRAGICAPTSSGAASMGPRASARGNHKRNSAGGSLVGCFNGAARVRTRKSRGRAGCGFRGRASMGPRASARGNDSHQRRRNSRHERFNGAARVRTRKCGSPSLQMRAANWLQWGRARPHAEMASSARPARRLMLSFNGAARVRTRKSEHRSSYCLASRKASMGPRASARGNRTNLARKRVSMCRLQWGRARPHAEIWHRVPWTSSPSSALQWGRARPHAEIPVPRRQPLRRRRASMGPRASARGNNLGDGDLTLRNPASMGPRASARGNEQTFANAATTVAASMGPRASARGNVSCS